MYAVILEVYPKAEGKAEYLKVAENVKSFLKGREGFISIERFQSLNDEGKVLSLSFWEDESSIEQWRNLLEHRHAQKDGHDKLFNSYRIWVCNVIRDYTESKRTHAPCDSNKYIIN